MRVRCISTSEQVGPRVRDVARSLTVGREYTVLSVVAQPNGAVRLRVVTDDRDLAVFRTSLFVVTEGRPSAPWSSSIEPDGTIELAPAAWLDGDFWENAPLAFPVDPGDEVNEVVASETAAMLAEDRGG